MLGPVTGSVFGNTLLVVGPEGLLAERAAAARVQHGLVERPDADVHKVTAAELADGRLAELSGASLFSSSSILVILDAAALPRDLAEQVQQVSLDHSDDLGLVVVHDNSARAKGLVDQLTKAGAEVIKADAIKPWELSKFVAGEAAAVKLSLDARAGQALVDAVGNDLRALAAAVSQLASDTGDGPVTEEVIARYFGGRADVTSFAVADDALAGRTAEAMAKLRWALSTGVAPLLLTSAFAGSLRALGKYLEVSSMPLGKPELARRVGVPPWKLKDLASQSYSWSQGGVATAIRAVAKADADVKGAASDSAFALEQLVLTVCGARGRR